MQHRARGGNVPQDDTIEGHPSTSGFSLPRPNFAHLRSLTDQRGLWEHARYDSPRPDHGFCNDDNARALVIASREMFEDVTDLAVIYLRYVLESRRPDGTFRNRCDAAGSWEEEAGSDDSQGRAWWALGAIAARPVAEWMRAPALSAFESSRGFESPHLRANAYAALGAAEVARSHSGFEPAVELLDRTTTSILRAARTAIPWPEGRLSYDNARIPEALVTAGDVLGDERRTSVGMRLLDWLTVNETRGSRFSFTPVAGRTPGEHGPAFDQQPIEAWAMADACHRALSVTGDLRWHELALRAGRWLLGANDAHVDMYDEASGGTYDGLTAHG
ncbi:MAG TPA: glycosyltransferase, partial [Acidimicrobiia bacterium]